MFLNPSVFLSPLTEPKCFYQLHRHNNDYIPRLNLLYPKWSHMQGGCLACSRLQGCKIESLLWLSCTDLYYARGAHGVLPMKVGGAGSQLDLPSLIPLSVAGCGRLQLVDNWPTHSVVLGSPLEGSWPWKTLLLSLQSVLGSIEISFSLSVYRDKFFPLVIDLSVSRYFCSKISDNR